MEMVSAISPSRLRRCPPSSRSPLNPRRPRPTTPTTPSALYSTSIRCIPRFLVTAGQPNQNDVHQHPSTASRTKSASRPFSTNFAPAALALGVQLALRLTCQPLRLACAAHTTIPRGVLHPGVTDIAAIRERSLGSSTTLCAGHSREPRLRVFRVHEHCFALGLSPVGHTVGPGASAYICGCPDTHLTTCSTVPSISVPVLPRIPPMEL